MLATSKYITLVSKETSVNFLNKKFLKKNTGTQTMAELKACLLERHALFLAATSLVVTI